MSIIDFAVTVPHRWLVLLAPHHDLKVSRTAVQRRKSTIRYRYHPHNRAAAAMVAWV
jgi:hypothetical protein